MRVRTTSLARGGIAELCGAGLDATAFRRELRHRLSKLIDFDAACINTVDPESLLITSSVGDGLSTPHARKLFELEEGGQDFNLLRQLPGPVAMHASTGGDVSRSQRMREIFLPLGLKDELRAPLRIDGLVWGYLHLFRGRPFTAVDVATIASLEREIARALRASAALRASSAGDFGVLLLDERGRIVSEGAGVRAWLTRLGDDVGGAVPHLVHVAGLRAQRGPVRARHRTTSGAWVSAHASALGRDTVVAFSAAHGADLAALLFHAHALTAREREVAALLASGHTNESIASQLHLRMHTAKDHVKAIFAKTRCAGRVDFVTRFA